MKNEKVQIYDSKLKLKEVKNLRQPGIEPGSTAWKAAMLTIIPLTPCCKGLESIFKKC